MSSNDVEEVQKTAENVEEKGKKQLNLFKPIGIRNPAYWQCMSYIAPSDAKKKWCQKDSIGTWCQVCEKEVSYNPKTNPRGVECHMNKFHQDLLNSYDKKKREADAGGTMKDYFPKEVKRIKLASRPNQEKITKLVALWTACSLRPFTISEDPQLQKIINFALQITSQLEMPSQNTNKKRIDELADEMRTKIIKIMADSG